MNEIINKEYINHVLTKAQSNIDTNEIEDVIAKIELRKPLSDYDVAILLYAPEEYDKKVVELATAINDNLYGNKRYFYGVTYVSDFCISTCRYCGDNICSLREGHRSTLTPEQLQKDIQAILDGDPDIQEICMLSGDNPGITIDKWIKYIGAIFEIYNNELTLNVAPFNFQEFKKIRESYPNNKLQFRVFQETYDEDVYRREHPSYLEIKDKLTDSSWNYLKNNGIYYPYKIDFSYRMQTQERALLAGFDNYGFGVLFGLNDIGHKALFETLAVKKHGEYLYKKYGIWPKTISFPRIQPSKGVDAVVPGYVSDREMERIIAVCRIMFPYSNMVITSRETAEFRSRIRPFINIEDFAAKPGPGGNYLNDVTFQMELADNRPGGVIRENIIEEGFIII